MSIPDDLKEYYEDAKRRAGSNYRSPEMTLIERIGHAEEELNRVRQWWSDAFDGEVAEGEKLFAAFKAMRDEIAALKVRKRELSTNLKTLQDHVGRCGKLLGCAGIDTDVEKEIAALKAQVERLSAPLSREEVKRIQTGPHYGKDSLSYLSVCNEMIARRAGGK